jgi:hypothetical protein
MPGWTQTRKPFCSLPEIRQELQKVTTAFSSTEVSSTSPHDIACLAWPSFANKGNSVVMQTTTLRRRAVISASRTAWLGGPSRASGDLPSTTDPHGAHPIRRCRQVLCQQDALRTVLGHKALSILIFLGTAVDQLLEDHFRCPVTITANRQPNSVSDCAAVADCAEVASSNPSELASRDFRSRLHAILSHKDSLQFPFDPSEVVESLRMERYTADLCADQRSALSSRAVGKPYYSVRPMVGISVRRHIQRLALRNWRELPFPRWPIDTTVEQVFEKLLVSAMQASNCHRR